MMCWLRQGHLLDTPYDSAFDQVTEEYLILLP